MVSGRQRRARGAGGGRALCIYRRGQREEEDIIIGEAKQGKGESSATTKLDSSYLKGRGVNGLLSPPLPRFLSWLLCLRMMDGWMVGGVINGRSGVGSSAFSFFLRPFSQSTPRKKGEEEGGGEEKVVGNGGGEVGEQKDTGGFRACLALVAL